jgi:hypothetical protein
MPSQRASRTQTVQVEIKIPSLSAIRQETALSALERQKEIRLESLISPQATKCSRLSEANHEPPSIASNHLPDRALEGEQTCSLKLPFSPHIGQSSVSYVDRMYPSRNTAQRGQKMRYCSGKSRVFLLIIMLSVLGVVQAMTGCQIMNDWLPDMFNGTGKTCCEEIGIICVDGRITEM